MEINSAEKNEKDMIIDIVLNMENIKKSLNKKQPKKIILIPGKVVNIVF